VRLDRIAPAQLRDGYRTNVDALHLAEFAPRIMRGLVFDLGAGAGAIGIAIARKNPDASVVLVESDADAATIARRNAVANVRVVERDVRDLAEFRGRAALIVCNPPYVPIGKGRTPKHAKSKMGDCRVFVVAARALLGRRARACFVYPPTHLLDFFSSMRACGLEPKRMRLVHSSKGAPARIALVECAAAKHGGLVIEPPLYED